MNERSREWRTFSMFELQGFISGLELWEELDQVHFHPLGLFRPADF